MQHSSTSIANWGCVISWLFMLTRKPCKGIYALLGDRPLPGCLSNGAKIIRKLTTESISGVQRSDAEPPSRWHAEIRPEATLRGF
jgi:hypothetical protein